MILLTRNRNLLEGDMHRYHNQHRSKSILDYLLYTLAGSALIAMSFSFLLWLRF